MATKGVPATSVREAALKLAIDLHRPVAYIGQYGATTSTPSVDTIISTAQKFAGFLLVEKGAMPVRG